MVPADISAFSRILVLRELWWDFPCPRVAEAAAGANLIFIRPDFGPPGFDGNPEVASLCLADGGAALEIIYNIFASMRCREHAIRFQRAPKIV